MLTSSFLHHPQTHSAAPAAPSPTPTSPDPITHVTTVLTPAERAVFLLGEIFDYTHAEIAAMLDLSEANCRQLLKRARQTERRAIKFPRVNLDRGILRFRGFSPTR